MTYRQNFVACIKVKNQILRELDNNTVHIPFGTEYTILLKNLDPRRAVVSIQIDGSDIGNDLVVGGNSSLELERFIGTDLNKGYKFKFIEKTQEISDYRGDKAEDGIIRISFKFEKRAYMNIPNKIQEIHHYHYPPVQTFFYQTQPYTPHEPIITCGNTDGSLGLGSSAVYSCNLSNDSVVASSSCAPITFKNNDVKATLDGERIQLSDINDSGITVKGDDSHQSFHNVLVGDLEDFEHVICFRLKGGEYQKPVTSAVTVNKKITCSSCGKKSRSSSKFCPNCSTRLV